MVPRNGEKGRDDLTDGERSREDGRRATCMQERSAEAFLRTGEDLRLRCQSLLFISSVSSFLEDFNLYSTWFKKKPSKQIYYM